MTSSVVVLLALAASAIACPFASMMRGHADSHGKMQQMAAHAHLNMKRNVQDVEALKASDVVQTFVLSSRVKTAQGNSFNQGFPVGYAVNGVETPEINVIAGKTYRFQVLSACNHPFYLTTDSRGKGRAPMEVGFDVPPAKSNPLICANQTILWRPDASLIGKDIWYHCTIHDNMGWFVRVKQQTFCDKYAQPPTFTNQSDLVTSVVDSVFDLLVAANSKVRDYFDGTVNKIDYTKEGNALKTLALRDALVAFFGGALGCQDGTIPNYVGPSLKASHAELPITAFEYDAFNTIVADVLKTGGVAAVDITAVIDLLNSADVRGAICNFGEGCFDSICTKYSKALNVTNQVLIDKVVEAAFAEVTQSAVQKPFFDGTKPSGSTNFFSNAAALTKLKKDFGNFLGRADVLGCTDPKFNPSNLTIPGLKGIHAAMPITLAVFNDFNDQVVKGVTKLGVAADDVTKIRALLDSTKPLICNQADCNNIPGNIAKVFALSVEQKPAGHHFFNQGFPAAYKIDGEFKVGLTLEVGKTYAFAANQGCLHPFYFSNGTGAGSPDFENGIAAADIGQVFCNGKTMTFTPQQGDVGKTIFYVCKNHNFMGGRICIVEAGSAATDCVLVPAAPSSVCDELVDNVQKTPNNIFKNASAILERVVVDLFTFGAVTPPAPLAKYFNGQQPPGSRDFINDKTNQAKLVTGLIQFFGTKLGCSDNSFPAYAKPTDEPNMKTVHQFMGISQAEFDAFNDKLVSLLANFNGTANTLSAKSATFVRTFLNTTSTDICSGEGCTNFQPPTLCEKWSVAAGLTQVDLVSKAVIAVFTNLTATGSPSRPLFSGETPCGSRDFINNKLNQAGLAKSLIAFFGQQGVLGCTDPNFPQYRGATDMEDVHKEMPITKAMFDQFLGSLAGFVNAALKDAVGPSLATDLDAVVKLFESDGVAKICNQDGCPKQGKFVQRQCPGDEPPGTTDGGNGTEATPEPEGTTEGTVGPDSAMSLTVSMFSVLVVCSALFL